MEKRYVATVIFRFNADGAKAHPSAWDWSYLLQSEIEGLFVLDVDDGDDQAPEPEPEPEKMTQVFVGTWREITDEFTTGEFEVFEVIGNAQSLMSHKMMDGYAVNVFNAEVPLKLVEERWKTGVNAILRTYVAEHFGNKLL